MGEQRNSIINWEDLLPREDWAEYEPITKAAAEQNIAITLAGGLAFSEYSGQLRNTKDVDLLVLPSDKDRLVSILQEQGWVDYYGELPYDRSWIWRGYKSGLICDIIWSLPNHRYDVDEQWLSRGYQVEVYGRWVNLISIEHLIVAKLFVFQKDRCDWTDILNVLNFSASCINWRYLLKLIGRDRGLLGGVLAAFRWICPGKRSQVPDYVWEKVGLLPTCSGDPLPDESRPFLLDTRNWFGANIGGSTGCLSGP
jgi:hypothetical protein